MINHPSLITIIRQS